MEEELETLLCHLGQDVGYMGLRIQKDVQKCLKNLKTTHDCKSYCDKLTDTLKKFSEYTFQFSKDLQGRIKDYNKEEEYKDITRKLQEISCPKTVVCGTSRSKEKGEDSLGPPNNNIDESPERPKYELKNEVLSQQNSLHIGGEDELKSEDTTKNELPVIQNENVSTNDLDNTKERLLNLQHPIDSPTDHAASLSHLGNSIVDSRNDISEPAVESCINGSLVNDSDMANNLEISHSEEIQLVEDHEEVRTSSDKDVLDTLTTDETIAQFEDITVDVTNERNHHPLNIEDNVTGSRNSNEPQKLDVIPLPYKPIFEKQNIISESPSSDANYIAQPTLNLHNTTDCHESDELPIMSVIPLPYEPIVIREKIVQESGTSNADSTSISGDGEKPALNSDKVPLPVVIPLPYKKIVRDLADPDPVLEPIDQSNNRTESSHHKENVKDLENKDSVKLSGGHFDEDSVGDKTSSNIDPGDDPDIEVVSIASSHDDNDRKAFGSGDGDEAGDDSDVEIIENIPPQVKTAKNDYDGRNEENDVLPHFVENKREEIGDSVSLTKTVANTPACDVEAALELHRDSDQGSSEKSPQKTDNAGLSNSDEVRGGNLPPDVPLDVDDEEIITSEEIYSEETIVNGSPTGGSSNNSADTIIMSPVDEALLQEEHDKNNAVSINIHPGEVDSTPKGTREEGQDSDAQKPDALEDTYSDTDFDAPTQRVLSNSSETTNTDFDAPTQRVLPNSTETTNVCEPNVSDRALVDVEMRNDISSNNIDDSIGLVGSEAAEPVDGSQGEEEEVITQDIDIPVPEGDDVVIENCDENDGGSQVSYEFNVEQDIQDSEEIVSTHSSENEGLVQEVGHENKEKDEISADSQESHVFDLETEQQNGEEIVSPHSSENEGLVQEVGHENKEKDEINTDSQESHVFDLENEQQNDEVLSSRVNVLDGSTITPKGSVASLGDKERNELQDGDNLAISEFESESSRHSTDIVDDASDLDNKNKETTVIEPNKKLKEKDRKSLLKVIAEYFSKRKRERAEEARTENDNDRKDDNKKETKKKNKEHGDKSPGKNKGTQETERKKSEDRVRTKSKKKKSISRKADKIAKEYTDFLSSRIDEASNSSVESAKDSVNIQEDSSGSSDIDATQIENFEATNSKDTAADGKTKNENSEEIEKDASTSRKILNKNDNEDSDGSEEIFAEQTAVIDETMETFSDFVDRLPLKPREDVSNNKNSEVSDDGFEVDHDITQKVDDIKKLRLISTVASNDDIFNQTTQKSSGKNSTEAVQDGENQDVQDKHSNIEEHDESQVVSPFKRKVVRPLPNTLSDDEDNKEPVLSHSQETDNSQVVSPFKKKCVKRLHSSDESDSEPPKKTSEAQGSRESNVFGSTTQPFKRTSVKRLQSSEEESETTQEVLNHDDSGRERGPKRRKVQRLPSSEHSSQEEVDSGQNKTKEVLEVHSDIEENQEMSEKSDLNIPPSQFKLDDKARDDFLEMFDRQSDEDPESPNDERSVEVDGAGDSENEDENLTVEASQFTLGDCDRDNLLNLLTDKQNDEEERRLDRLNEPSDESRKVKSEPFNKKDEDERQEDGVFNMGQFKMNNEARDEFLDLLSSDTRDDTKEDENVDKPAESGSSQKTTIKDEVLKLNDNDIDRTMEPSQFKLNNAARDEFLDLLNGEQSDDSRAAGDEQGQNLEKKKSTSLSGTCRTKSLNKNDDLKDGDDDEEIGPSQFKLSDKARDDFLDMLNSDQSNDSREKTIDGNEAPSPVNDETDQPKDSSNNDDSKINNDDSEQQKDALNDNLEKDDEKNEKDKGEAMDVDKDAEEGIGDRDDVDLVVTENSQGIDDIDESDGDIGATPADFSKDEDEEEKESKTGEKDKSSEFKLDEKEKDELLHLLSDHINKRKVGSDPHSSSSDSDAASDNGDENECRKKKGTSKKLDKDILLELLQEYENAVSGKVIDNALVETLKNGNTAIVDNMSSDDENLREIARSDFCEDSGADSGSVLLDVLREETVEQPEEGRRKKSRNSTKEAWNAYQQLLKDNDDLSDTDSDISTHIDIDDLELDFSDQERKKKERILYDKLKKQFDIDKELIVKVERSDLSEFDLSSFSRKEGKYSSVVDRLCDLSNVLQKRKKPDRKRAKVKLRKPSPTGGSSVSANSTSDSDDDTRSSSSSYGSDDSLQANRDSASGGASPFQHMSDDNAEQEKLVKALWENIKYSSDENSSSSSDSTNISSDDDKGGRKKGKGSRGKKKEEKKGSDKEVEEDTGDSMGSEKSDDDNGTGGDESEDKEKTEGEVKEADLDSSDEEDFVGVRKNKGAWKHDPLLKSGFTSDDESDSGSDASPRKGRSGTRVRRKLKRKRLVTESTEANSEVEKDGTSTPAIDTGNSSDSDVEFVMEKTQTPNKIVIDEAEDESPSKRGKGRRNIRALVEDDELAEATKQAKKEETERIKRLQEREKAKENFSQSQSFASQLSEDESDPLILDVHEELQIKVHPKITKKLKPHQRIGIQFMWDSCYESVKQLEKNYEGSGCILAHCMGLGKTLQALGLIHTLFNYKVTKTKHVLVVCPLSTVSNWRNEYKLAYRDIRHCNVPLHTIQDKRAAMRRFEIVKNWWKSGGILVMGYECFGILINDHKLDKWAQQGLCKKEDVLQALVSPGPDLVICDEGHLLRNKQTQRNLALNKVETRRRIILTGTPLQNNLLEYYYMVHFVKPNLLGTEKEYKTNFINPISNGQFENSTAIDILFMKKRTHVLHKILNKTVQRVEDTELKRYLPELIDQAIFVKLSDLQVKFYNTYLDGANARPVEYTASGHISRKNFLADIQILRYICTHPDTVTIAKKSGKSKIKEQDVIDDNMDEAIEDKVFSKGDWYKGLIPESGVKKPELGTKMMVTLGIVKEAIAYDDKVLIFSQTHAEMDCLEFFLKQEFKFKKGTDYNRMDGTISPEVRTQMCDSFNSNHKRLRVFIMSTKVGGLGLNLTAANRVILLNVNWNPSYDTQSVFRAFRFGQNKAVYVYRLIAIDTMEEKMYQRQVTKLAVAHRVVDKHQITRHYSEADIQEFYCVRPTIEGERPVPNVPEDTVLAKLVQKYQFLYKWHEHQALLANRPEEDLNEQQKNAAWEEFNKKAVEPPLQAMPPPLPQFLSATSILDQPGPSGMQNRAMAPGVVKKRGRGRPRKSSRLNPVPDPLRAMSTYVVPRTLPVLIKQTPDGPKLVVQTHGRIHGKPIPLQLGLVPAAQNTERSYLTTDRPSMSVSVIDVGTGAATASVDVGRDDDASRKIQEINSLVSAQTTPELISGFNTTTTSTFNQNTVNGHPDQASRIDEINSIISASLGQHEAVSSQNWDEDGMNSTLLSLNLPRVTEDSANEHFADHNYSLPKTNPLNFRTPSADDFCPTPLPTLPSIPCPLFVDVDAPLDLEPRKRFFKRKNKHEMYKRPIVTQRMSSADDFRPTIQTKYMPRPLFVDVKAPLGPRPDLGALNPPSGQKVRSTTSSKPVQSRPPTNVIPQQVRLGSGVTLTTQSSSKTTPPPAHSQKPSVSIIPQPASTKSLFNVATKPPPPFVPQSKSIVQNPLNLTKNGQNVGPNTPARSRTWIQKEQTLNQQKNVVGNDLMNSKQKPNPLRPPANIKVFRRIDAPPRVAAATPLVQLPTKISAPPPLTRPVLSPSFLPASAPPTSDPLQDSAGTTTSTTTTQQSPLQQRMRNFMEHLHHLQKSMTEKEGGGPMNLGDSNNGRVWNPTGNNQGTLTNINLDKTNSVVAPVTLTNKTRVVPGMPNPRPFANVIRVAPKALSPVIGGLSTTNVAGLNAARNLSNITKTHQKTPTNKVVGVTSASMTTPLNPPNGPIVRVVGTLPSPIPGLNTVTTTSRVVLPSSTGLNVPRLDGNSPRVVRKIITTSPTGVRRNIVINPVRKPINGNVPRVITRVVGGNTRVNPVELIHENGTTKAASTRMVPAGGNVTARIVPGSTGTKKIVISQKGDVQQNSTLVQNQTPSIRFDSLSKNIVTNLNRIAAKRFPPKLLPPTPQRSFNRGTNLKTYQAKKNNKPSRASSLPSLSLPQSPASVSKSNKENRAKRKLALRTNNNMSTTNLTSPIDLSNEEDTRSTSSGSLSKDMVNTLKKKGVSINYLKKDVINLD